MPHGASIIRGAPRYLSGPAAGAAGRLTLIPEAWISADGRTRRPAGVVVLYPHAVRRHAISASRRPGVGRRAPDVPARLPAAAGRHRGGAAESWVVAGTAYPEEDPRLAGVFGPTENSARGVTIRLWRVAPRARTAAEHRAPLGTVEVAAGALRLHLRRDTGIRAWRPAVLFAVIYVALAWWLRRSGQRQPKRSA